MKNKIMIGLIAVVMVALLVVFSGCFEEKAPTISTTPSAQISPSPPVAPTTTPEITITPYKENPSIPGLTNLRLTKSYDYYSGKLGSIRISAKSDKPVIFKFVYKTIFGRNAWMQTEVRARAEDEAKERWYGDFDMSAEREITGAKYFMVIMIDKNEKISYSTVFNITYDELPESERGLVSKTVSKHIDLPINVFISPYSSIPSGIQPKIYDVNITKGSKYGSYGYVISWKTDKLTKGKVLLAFYENDANIQPGRFIDAPSKNKLAVYSDTSSYDYSSRFNFPPSFSQKHSVEVYYSGGTTYRFFKIYAEDEQGRVSSSNIYEFK